MWFSFSDFVFVSISPLVRLFAFASLGEAKKAGRVGRIPFKVTVKAFALPPAAPALRGVEACEQTKIDGNKRDRPRWE